MIIIEGVTCPACGHRLGMVSNRILCSSTGCTRRDAAHRILADPERDHIVEFTEGSFGIKHPLIERLDGELFTCSLHTDLAGYAGPPVEPGMYRVGTEYYDAHPVRSFEKIEEPNNG